MNKQLQIELWAECRCNRCSFCNLELSAQRSKKLGKEENSPSDLVPNSIKIKYLENGIEYLKTVDWNNYDTLLLRGGEIFNSYDEEITDTFNVFIENISELIKEGKLKKVFLITSLKYPYKTSLLKLTLELFLKNHVDITKSVLVGTSWDPVYRFTKRSLEYWNKNIEILNKKRVPVHITSILTQKFIDLFFSHDKDVLRIMDMDFDFIPAQGKPELLKLKDFFPKRNDCLRFLITLQQTKYAGIWYRLLHQDYRRAESIFFTKLNKLQTRDLATFHSVLEDDIQDVLPCQHPTEYANYEDSDKCFICDVERIK